jgi:PilZ domain
MSKPKQEKRAATRVAWEIPASVSFRGHGRAQVELKDISTRGLFFFTEANVERQSKLEIVLMMPPEVGPFGRQWVCCEATVVRVENQPGAKVGVAAVINRCEALPQV